MVIVRAVLLYVSHYPNFRYNKLIKHGCVDNCDR